MSPAKRLLAVLASVVVLASPGYAQTATAEDASIRPFVVQILQADLDELRGASR